MRNRPNLFEVMSKAPQTQAAKPERGLPFFGGLKKRTTPAQQLVSKALTEEEAAAELASQRAKVDAQVRAEADARERVERGKQDRRKAREAKKQARAGQKEESRRRAAELATQRASASAARRAAEKAAAAPASTLAPKSVPIRVAAGRRTFSVSTAGFMVVAGLACAMVFGAYALGHRSGSGGAPLNLTKVAAIKGPGESSESGEPLLMPGDSPSDLKRSGGKPGRTGDSELTELMTPPASVMQNVTANQPSRADSGAAAVSPEKARLNYVQIEWFQITVEKSSEDLRAELDDVHRFLTSRGVDSFAREHSRGFILYSAKGFRMSRDTKVDRDVLLKKLQQLGQEYFRGGGRYQFKDCFFVSHGKAMKGRPVIFKEQ